MQVDNGCHPLANTTPPSSPNQASTPTVPKRARKMTQAVLCGSHDHETQDGQRVHIWIRDGKYLARARWRGQPIGLNLGADEVNAGHEFRRLLTAMEDGTFVPGREARRRKISEGRIPKFKLRGLFIPFLADKRRLRGKNTARDYQDRLMHVLDFAELPNSERKWPLAQSIDRDFAIALRQFLFARDVTRNGRAGATTHKMAISMVCHCLETLRNAINWACRADVRKLPPGFFNPITDEIIPTLPPKDPLRTCPISLDQRIAMVKQMDEWQLLHLSTFLVLPTRIEDISGAIVSDFDLQSATWRLGTRMGGNDYNKGRVNVQMPLPPVLLPLLRQTIGARTDGPMFRSREAWDQKKQFRRSFANRREFENLVETALISMPANEVNAEQDRKEVIRGVLRDCGGISNDVIGKDIKELMMAVGIDSENSAYDLRAAVTTGLNRAGVRHLELRYLTMHSLTDILYEYTSLEPVGEMQKYFQAIQPLLLAIMQRAAGFGIHFDNGK